MTGTQEIAAGLCQCGCGERTKLAPHDDPRKGHVKGQPFRYLNGHWRKQTRWLEDDNGCWIWQLSRTGAGYGYVRIGGVAQLAHRVFYVEAKGPIPPGMVLDHLCRVRGCVNPDHLEAVSDTTNIRRGARTKLTEEKVRAIRCSGDGPTALAARFDVSVGAIKKVLSGENWPGVSA